MAKKRGKKEEKVSMIYPAASIVAGTGLMATGLGHPEIGIPLMVIPVGGLQLLKHRKKSKLKKVV